MRKGLIVVVLALSNAVIALTEYRIRVKQEWIAEASASLALLALTK
jgi:hypothetical protein